MALLEDLSQQAAYDMLVDIPVGEQTRIALIGAALAAPGVWAWESLPDGSGAGVLAPPGATRSGWSVNHVTP